MIVAQIEAVAGDLGDRRGQDRHGRRRGGIEAVAAALDELPAGTPVVLDPVMIAESGGAAPDPDAEQALRELLLPRATVVTPNVPEARVLAGRPGAATRWTATALAARGAGRRGARRASSPAGTATEATDVLLTEDGTRVEIPGVRHPDGAAHGSGCTHSSALAAAPRPRLHLAGRRRPRDAADASPADGACAGPAGLGRRRHAATAASARPRPRCRAGGRCAATRVAATPRGERPPRRRAGPGRSARQAGARAFAIIAAVRFLRMKPGHGEVLLAEGDVDVRRGRADRSSTEFRRQLDEGMWAAVPITGTGGAARRAWSRPSRTSRVTPTACIFFPRAAGGR